MIHIDDELYKKYARYNSMCIFKNNNLESDSSNNLEYKNIKFIFPILTDNTFHACLGINSYKKIIGDTNSFINDPVAFTSLWGYDYENTYRMHTKLNIVYDYLINNDTQEYIDQTVCFFMTPFDSANIGHNLSCIFDFIKQYRRLKLTCPIVISEYSKLYPNVLKVLQLFFAEEKIIFIKNNTIYNFKHIYIFKPITMDIRKHMDIVYECRDKSINQIIDINNYKNKNIFLIKTNTHKNVVNKNMAFNALEIKKIVSVINNWIFIEPESTSIYEIIAYLTYANKIVTCFGAINYAHMLFFSSEARIIYLKVMGRSHDNPYSYHRYQTVLEVPNDLDSIIPLLKQHIEF
jgi:hypothetical protein